MQNPLASKLRGKAKFIRSFVANYIKITKGFMCLLKKGAPFCWDEVTQRSFEMLKHNLTLGPLLSPPDYGKDLLLYLASAESTIVMVLVQEEVLVQEDDALKEHVIYYISRGLVGLKLNYTHVEKLALAVVHVVQRFCHNIFLHKTIVVVVMNPFQYVLT
jgi:hypothetical protein